MFASDAHNDVWHRMARTAKHEMFDDFCALCAQHIESFRNTTDDLRLLFYVGMHFPKHFFEHALSYFEHWQETPPEEARYRQSVFLYALKHTLPPRETERRAYMHAGFCSVMGITDPDALRAEYEASI